MRKVITKMKDAIEISKEEYRKLKSQSKAYKKLAAIFFNSFLDSDFRFAMQLDEGMKSVNIPLAKVRKELRKKSNFFSEKSFAKEREEYLLKKHIK